MYGVVLWSSASDRKAVIWCEDHGDLAFYNGQQDEVEAPEGELDPGDLVQFDIRRERDLRLVSNPRLVAQDQYPRLADKLKHQRGSAPCARAPGADVVPLYPDRMAVAQRA